MQARKKDLINLGIAAVGAYNVRNGWRRAEGHVSTFYAIFSSAIPFLESQDISEEQETVIRRRMLTLRNVVENT